MSAKPKICDVSPFTRGNLATAIDPVLGFREAKFILDIDDLEAEIDATLRRIRDRDGKRRFREGAKTLRDHLDGMIAQNRPRAC